ncbi:O-methyltransferase-domain-containing protein [Suillus placidus]|uniref:O-methyltransferase-domain-containing protein n=1 Tax=Suillus placidus TaxID=48579 RepID=A0A9P6ZUU4_9AGAM|nr:O-methyltransferase-domain-containing protein [Suillus placidus]
MMWKILNNWWHCQISWQNLCWVLPATLGRHLACKYLEIGSDLPGPPSAIAEYKKTEHGAPSADATTFYPLDLTTDTLALKKAIRLLEGAYHQLSSILALPQHTVMNFVLNYNWACIGVALRSRLADVLDQHPEGPSVNKLAEAVNLDKAKTERVLRVLTLMSCFKEGLSLKHVVRNARSHSQDISQFARVVYETMIDEEFSRSHRKEGMKGNYYELIKDDEEKRDDFHRAMLDQSNMMGTFAVLHHYPWDDISSVVDVGSGIGAFSPPMARMFPHLRITDQDLPEVMVRAQNAWEKNAPEALLDGRVKFIPINFLEDAPVLGKDVYYLKHIIHNWPDAEATTFRNIRKAVGPCSRVLIRETNGLSVAPEPMLPNFGAGSHTTYQTDLTMWFALNCKERTLEELNIVGQGCRWSSTLL